MLNCVKCENLRKWCFFFLDISPRPLELQRCTIPHFKAIDLLFWPLAWLLTLRLITFAVESKMSCKLFSPHPLEEKLCLFRYVYNESLELSWILGILFNHYTIKHPLENNPNFQKSVHLWYRVNLEVRVTSCFEVFVV